MKEADNNGYLFFCGHRSMIGLHTYAALQRSTYPPNMVLLAPLSRWALFDKQLNPAQKKAGFLPRIQRLFYHWKRLLQFFLIWLKHPVPIRWVADVNAPSWIKWLKTRPENSFLIAAYPQLFGTSVLNVNKEGFFNIHPSLLPLFAGAHPHFWAIRTGAQESGITVHQMTERVDDGPIVAQVAFPIAGLRYQQFYLEFRKHLPKLLELLFQFWDGGARTQVVEPKIPGTRFKNNQPEDARILWKQHSRAEILQIIRTDMAFCYWQGQVVRVWEADCVHLPQPATARPGEVVAIVNAGVLVQCLDGQLLLQSIKRIGFIQAARQWAKSHNLQVQDQFQ